MRDKGQGLLMMAVLVLAVGSLIAAPAYAQVNPPDLGVCDEASCEALPDSLCSDGGFKISLTGFTPANDQNSGTATYTYEICSPAAGICNGEVRYGESCLDNTFCQRKGGDTDPDATCNRDCAVDEFRALSHFDVTFPELGGTGSCLGENTEVTGSCSTGNFVLGDGSCFDGEASQSFVAKCDNTSLTPGQCLTMTVNIAGELTSPGLGAAIVVDKESNECTASCIAGPSCDSCVEPPPEEEPCLTRTLGFWGTHPHIADMYDPVTVCGHEIDGQSANACSTSEALCTSALDKKGNPNYLQLVAQLTAAKLNLNATEALAEEAACGDFVFNSESIQQIIDRCDTALICGGTKKTISDSGCIEALNAFNNSVDTGFDQTPDPFNKPGPAQVSECQAARGNGQAIGDALCSTP